MKRSYSLSAALTGAALTLFSATPAFGQDYSGGEDAATAVLCGVYGCLIVVGLLFAILWVWMLVDAIMRQEYEFPNSSGNSKIMWILLLVLTTIVGVNGIIAIVYYFVVFKKIKRGSVPPTGGTTGGGYYAPTPPAASAPMAPPAPPAPPDPPAPPAPPIQ